MMAGSSETPAPARKPVAENVKETLESIVVAFILAFVFRAFIVEAFVIPTGSMAPTLYGDQVTNTCSTCGFEYAVGMPPQRGLKLRCPNCDTLADELRMSQVQRPDSGDRILVHKWTFDIGGEWLGPQRWDVTVFKDPRDGTTNFIKRLIGLPGEMLEIIDGDVYTAPLKELSPELIEAFEQLRRDVYAHRLSAEGRHGADPAARREFTRRYHQLNEQLLPKLKIQRKIPHATLAQKSLWFNVYDHDFLPNYERLPSPSASDRIGWKPVDAAAEQAWNTTQREITFISSSDEPLAIQFAGKPIEDFYAYNNDGTFDKGLRRLVGDVRLRFVWFPDSGTGGITLRMNRDRDEFVADLHSDGTLRIDGLHPDSNLPGKRQLIGEKKIEAFASGRAVRVEFINLDYRVALFVNGEEQIASTPAQYAPNARKLSRLIDFAAKEDDSEPDLQPSRVSIAARNMQCRLRHVAIERDVYYRSQKQGEERAQDQPSLTNPYHQWPGWGTAGFPIMLRLPHPYDGQQYPGEYFMCGDNSPASKDSRMWWEIGPHLRHLDGEYQVGTVPGDQLIGKAFFVYWPAGYRPSWGAGIGLIPNFGQMRWIR